MPTITTTDGVRLNYVEQGDPAAHPVVLIAGFKAPATSWSAQQKALVEAGGFRVLSLDRRGHGESEASDHGNTMARHGADIHEFLEHLDLHDATLVGGSMGGNSIWAYTSAFGTERVRDIVIVDQTPKMLNAPDWAFGFYGYDESNRDTHFATGIPDPGVVSILSKGPVRIARLLRALDVKKGKPTFTAAELEVLNDHAKADWRDAIAAARVPVLFIAGRQSEFWPCEHAAASAALNPRASSVVIEKDGHAANIEQPADFNVELLRFLRR